MGCCHRARPSGRDGRQETEKIVCRHSLDRLNASMIKQKKKKKTTALEALLCSAGQRINTANTRVYYYFTHPASGMWWPKKACFPSTTYIRRAQITEMHSVVVYRGGGLGSRGFTVIAQGRERGCVWWSKWVGIL